MHCRLFIYIFSKAVKDNKNFLVKTNFFSKKMYIYKVAVKSVLLFTVILRKQL